MKRDSSRLQACGPKLWLVLVLALAGPMAAQATVVFSRTSPYHHIRVIDQRGIRTLSFNGSMESRMSLQDPLQGHFEYINYFHVPWLWTPEMTNVLMMGLGGGSIQRAYEHYYPDVHIQTVELDPMVLQVAKDYFRFKESSRQKVEIADGRVYLRRSGEKYGTIIMDAYSTSRYGSYIPHHLVTREFFQLASEHLTENGVLAYNVMGSTRGWRSELVGAVYKTLRSVFPQVYLFPAGETSNVVMLATKAEQPVNLRQLQQRADQLIRQGKIKLPRFPALLRSFQSRPPPGSYGGPVLSDDYAPVHGLAN